MPKPSAPPAPDYVGAANAQGQANVTAAQAQASLNNPNITNPYGSQTVSYQPTGPNGDQQAYINQTLTPAAQSALDSQQRVQQQLGGLAEQGIGQVRNTLNTPFSYNGPAFPVNAGQTAYDAQMKLLQPQIDRSQASLEQRLANQGITPGSDAYKNATYDWGQQTASLQDQAALQGVTLQQQSAQQALANQLALYNQPLNQVSALMSGSQIQAPQFQQYGGGGSIQGAPLLQAATNQGNYDTAAYNSQQQGLGGLFGGLGTAAGSILGGSGPLSLALFSDRRLKSNIVRVGTHPRGFGVYEYDIFGRRERGVMAQEVELVIPEAVMLHHSGFKMVNYGALNV